VVGAGPAGSAAAAALAARGRRVLLLEKDRLPRRKVCGEFLSGRAVPSLERLGVLDEVSSIAERIDRGTLQAFPGLIGRPAGEFSKAPEQLLPAKPEQAYDHGPKAVLLFHRDQRPIQRGQTKHRGIDFRSGLEGAGRNGKQALRLGYGLHSDAERSIRRCAGTSGHPVGHLLLNQKHDATRDRWSKRLVQQR